MQSMMTTLAAATATPHSTATNATGDPFTEDEGYCPTWTLWVTLPLVASVILFVVVISIDVISKLKPSRGTMSYGRPWAIIHMLFSMALWNFVPPPLVFIVFYHIIGRDTFVTVSRVACLENYQNIPYVQLYLALMGVMILVSYRPPAFVATASKLLFPDTELQALLEEPATTRGSHTPMIAMIGATSRGAVYLDVLRRAREQWQSWSAIPVAGDAKAAPRQPRLVLVDIVGCREWVENNAEVLNLPPASDVELGVEIAQIGPYHNATGTTPTVTTTTTTSARGDVPLLYGDVNGGVQTLGTSAMFVPLSMAFFRDGQVDEILLAPYIRRMPPVGDFVSPAEEVNKRFALLLAEVKRSLRAGGKVRFVDGLMDVMATESALREAGFEIEKGTHSLEVRTGTIFFMSKVQYAVVARKPVTGGGETAVEQQPEDDVNAAATSMALFAQPNEPSRTGFLLDAEPTEDGATVTASSSVVHASSAVGYAALVGTQVACFAAQCAIAAALADPTFVPDAVDPSNRVSMLWMNTALNYPMMAYFSRTAALSAAPSSSLAGLVSGAARRELLATAVSLAFSALIFLPELGFQYGLAQTSLSNGTRTTIANVVSIVIGIVGYKRASAMRETSALASCHCSRERYDAYVASEGKCFGLC